MLGCQSLKARCEGIEIFFAPFSTVGYLFEDVDEPRNYGNRRNYSDKAERLLGGLDLILLLVFDESTLLGLIDNAHLSLRRTAVIELSTEGSEVRFIQIVGFLLGSSCEKIGPIRDLLAQNLKILLALNRGGSVGPRTLPCSSPGPISIGHAYAGAVHSGGLESKGRYTNASARQDNGHKSPQRARTAPLIFIRIVPSSLFLYNPLP